MDTGSILGRMEAQGSFWIVLSLGLVLLTMAGLLLLWLRRRERQGFEIGEDEGAYAEIDDGLRVHYVQTGRGKDLILLHGIGASTYTWRLLVPLLSKNFRVTALDLPGFGRSSKNPRRDHGLDQQSQSVLAVMDHLKIKKSYFVGSSMGGAIALWIAKNFEDRVLAVMVLAPAVHPRLLPLNLTILSKVLHPSSKVLLTRPVLRQILKKVVSRQELISEDTITNYLRPYAQEGAAIQTFLKATSILSDRRLPGKLKGITVPVHILWGESDQMVPRSVIQELQKQLPHASLILHPTAGHHPQEDEPEWVASQIHHSFR